MTHEISANLTNSTADQPSLKNDGVQAPYNQGVGPCPESKQSHPAMQRQVEPIAIVGMGCRLPGQSSSPEELWNLLSHGLSGHCTVPRWRYNAEAFYHPDSDRPGSINSMGGYFIQEDVKNFEPSFFGINNLEAKSMDAQQRKLLECVYECFENAGAPLEKLSGTNVGCYVANFALDYPVMQLQDPEYLGRYDAIGSAPNILANRLSHAFDLRGPSFTLDTACSSSLYSLHCACTALDNGECESAVVASANLIQSPQHQLLATKAGILSNSSTCRTFDASADGYGRAEGVAALYLKRLSDAVRDGDSIRAVARGTSVNSNGKTTGIMLPSAEGQEEVMRKAYARAGLDTNETDYVEAHGTGTAVGDPIEVEAISRVFAHRTGRSQLIGSVKTNLGHSEATSGIASVMKVVLALENGVIPPTIGIEAINPEISALGTNVNIVETNTPWPTTACPRASVNSFGFGGANGHAIIDSAAAHLPSTFESSQPVSIGCGARKMILPFSAHTKSSLERQIAVLSGIAPQDFEREIGKIAFTLSNRRTRLAHRAFAFLNEDRSSPSKLDLERVESHTVSTLRKPVAFIFTGQGAQWPRMGYELLAYFPHLRHMILFLDQCLHELKHAPEWTILSVLSDSSEESNINQPLVAQTVCTAVQIALVDLFHMFSIRADVVLGHSSGEIAAAYAAGHLTRRQALILAYYRGYVVSQTRVKGAMLAVEIGADAAQTLLDELGLVARLNIACCNSPSSVTLSGDADAVAELQNYLGKSNNIFSKILRTGETAYHSFHMSALGPQYEGLIEHHLQQSQKNEFDLIKGNPSGSARMISSVTGAAIEPTRLQEPSYWRFNMEKQVLFDLAVRTMLRDEDFHIVEVGPHPALQAPIRQIRESLDSFNGERQEHLYDCSLVRNKNSLHCILELLGRLFVRGHEPDFVAINKLHRCERRVSHIMPPYPWNYEESPPLWKEPRAIRELRQRQYQRHDLLGSRVTGGNGLTFLWRNQISVKDVPWLQDHQFGPTILFPAAGFIAIAIEAMCQVLGCRLSSCPGLLMRNIKLFKALPIPDDGTPIELFTEMRRLELSGTTASAKWWQFSISTFANEDETSHAGGIIAADNSAQPSACQISVSEERLESQAVPVWFNKLKQVGLNWGPSFKQITEIYVDRMKTLAEAITKVPLWKGEVDQCSGEHQYIAHPAIIDSMLQTVFLASAEGNIKNIVPRIPIAIDEIKVAARSSVTPCDLWTIRAASRNTGFGTIVASTELHNAKSQVLFSIRGGHSIIYQGLSTEDSEQRLPMLRICWKPDVTFMDHRSSDELQAYLEKFVSVTNLSPLSTHEKLLAGCVDLLVHQNPRMRILLLGFEGVAKIDAFSDLLQARSLYRRFTSLHQAILDGEGQLLGREISSGRPSDHQAEERSELQCEDFDVVITDKSIGKPCSSLHSMVDRFAGRTRFVTSLCPNALELLEHTQRPFVKACTSMSSLGVCAIGVQKTDNMSGAIDEPAPTVYLVGSQRHEDIHVAIEAALRSLFGMNVIFIPFQDVSTRAVIALQSLIIFTVEYHNTILDGISAEDMTRLKVLTDSASKLLWLTRGNLTVGAKPEASLVLGLSRALMLEQPSLKMMVFDVELNGANVEDTGTNIAHAFFKLTSEAVTDLEYSQKHGSVHVSRWIPEDALNERFQAKQESRTDRCTLESAGPIQLGIERPGQLESLRFVSSEPLESNTGESLPEDHVEVHAKSYGMNAKMVSTLPLVFSTALYALKHRANLQRGESILIHSAAGGLGIAAIQIAHRFGATIYATVGTEEKRNFLINSYDILPERIYHSRDSSFLHGILAATEGLGVDVVLNSLTGELLHDSLRACGSLGRFIEVGKKDILDNGRLEMDRFAKDLAFIAFDLLSIYYSERAQHRALWQSLMQETMQLLREAKITPIKPLKVFDISEISQAFRFFAKGSRMGKVAVSMADPRSEIEVVPSQYDTHFDPLKTYLMIGCFGGIGRSIARWMLSQGARSFVFLSRSGATQSSALHLISDLEAHGAHTRTVKGDVGISTDVLRAVKAASSPVGGVIHASMSLKATLWKTLSCEDWNDGIEAKMKGAWNLHESLNGKDAQLEFFLLISSVSGSIGSPTEPNYCAANAFLDNFARFRRSHGLPAVALGLGVISEVGYLHEHPEMQAVYSRRGLQAINENEMLQLVDLAIADGNTSNIPAMDELMASHLLTGLELQHAKKQAGKSNTAIESILADPRASLLTQSYERDIDSSVTFQNRASSRGGQQLPAHVHEAMARGAQLQEAIKDCLGLKLCDIIMLPVKQLNFDSTLTEFGLDSMLAAEFRGYIFQRMGVDVPFMTLLSNATSLNGLAQLVATAIEKDTGGTKPD
ncbi:MAG: Type I Iterative PKS [Alyxoria varia]|nr:MAG: Type I Iterative PKS [Alyxoria varia]